MLHAVEDVFDHVPPSRETPTDREPSFSAPRPRAGGPVESAAAWLRAFVSSRDLFCLATENRTRTRAMPLSQAQTKVRKISGVGGCGHFLGDNHAAIPWL